MARRISARRPRPCFRPPTGSASAGCRSTGLATAARPLSRTGRWHPRPKPPPASPTRWGSTGPHALACAALLPDRVLAVVNMAGLAPFGAEGLDWFAGMAPSGVASLRAAAEGRAAKERYEASAPEGDPGFTPEDQAALDGEWSWVLEVVRPALAAGPGGLIDDDLAYVAPWGFDPATITVPVLLPHGGRDRIVPSTHGEWLAPHAG